MKPETRMTKGRRTTAFADGLQRRAVEGGRQETEDRRQKARETRGDEEVSTTKYTNDTKEARAGAEEDTRHGRHGEPGSRFRILRRCERSALSRGGCGMDSAKRGGPEVIPGRAGLRNGNGRRGRSPRQSLPA